MSNPSRYPGFHKHVTKAYLVIIGALAIGLPILYLFTGKPPIQQIIGIIVFVITSYIVYWLIVRLNCYGTPLRTGRNSTSNNHNNHHHNNNHSNNNSNNNNTSTSNSSSSTHSSSNASNGGTHNHHHPTFASYRLGGLAEIFRRIGGSSANDEEISCETGEVLRPPPPTYNTALEGAGLPPPYMNDPIDINVNNSESPQMSERYTPPRRPVPSVPSSSSLRRPAPPISQHQSSTQSIQDISQDPSSSIMSDSSPRRPVPSIPQLSGRPVPPVPTSSSTSSSLDNTSQPPRRPVPPVPATSSSALSPKLYKRISHDSNVNNNRK